MTEKIYDKFVFTHNDGDDDCQLTLTFNTPFTDRIVEQFIHFLRGCGHLDDCIYGCLQHYSEEYFQCRQSIGENFAEFRESQDELIKHDKEYRADKRKAVD